MVSLFVGTRHNLQFIKSVRHNGRIRFTNKVNLRKNGVPTFEFIKTKLNAVRIMRNRFPIFNLNLKHLNADQFISKQPIWFITGNGSFKYSLHKIVMISNDSLWKIVCESNLTLFCLSDFIFKKADTNLS